MVSLEKAVIARHSLAGHKFEILVDPNLAAEVKTGKDIPINDLMAIDRVFKDAHKGDEQSPEIIKSAFKTEDLKEIAKIIITKGEVQLTTDQRRALKERKTQEIIAYFARHSINPQTKTPNPPQRIENAMAEARITVDIFEPVQEQIPKILKEIKKIIPISIENLEVAIKIPVAYAGKGQSFLHKYNIKKQEWASDGSFIAMVEIPAGMKNDIIGEVNKFTQGTASIRFIEK
ncbi:MAG: ribosome assembly factor SBDS [Candidatus Diapherotrites archaeon CG08_land_8_20_14_0_20_34_12]|nr:MAG: ribosome assembly factor SBDS [Candidatus Diapherotrites archaeon CG08_land_8_20_14_0_20_34_12]